jgi:hypothetical protein
VSGPDGGDDERPFSPETEPFAGFELGVLTDRPVYAPGETVRITVTATNAGTRWAEHRYGGWQRYVLSVRDELHREVATDAVRRRAPEAWVERWLPGQMAIFPTYWGQQEGPIVPGWGDEPPGPRLPAGRYRIRCTWQGREPNSYAELADAWTGWFELV